jgi:dipeptidyl aminopeptidase/acylaminoacyl peptidase
VQARVASLEQLIRVNRKARGPYIQLAQLYLGAGRKDLALETYHRYLEVDPGNAYIWERVQILLGKADPVKAAEYRTVEQARGVADAQARFRRGALVAAGAVVLIGVAVALKAVLFPSARPLVVADYSAFAPRWSPDGRKLAFVADRGGARKLWVYERRDGSLRELPAVLGWSAAFAWSPDGLAIAYGCQVEEEDLWGEGVFVVDLLDGSTRRVAMGSEFSWSADGRSLAMVCAPSPQDYRDALRTGYYPRETLCVVNVTTADVTRLDAADAQRPSWEPNGSRIVFHRQEDVEPERIARAEGFAGGEGDSFERFAEDALSGGADNLLEADRGMAREMEARQRREREKAEEGGLFFASPSNVYAIDAGGGSPLRLTDDNRSSDALWSPEGRSILYTHVPAEGRQPQLWRMDPDGSNRRRLVAADIEASDPRQVALTPDGRRLVFRARVKEVKPEMAALLTHAEPADLYVVRLARGAPRRLENKHSFKAGFALAPDGERLAYEVTNKDSGRSELWLMGL